MLTILVHVLQEYDTPTNLYESNGIFRGMCERSSITLEDIRHALAKQREEGGVAGVQV